MAYPRKKRPNRLPQRAERYAAQLPLHEQACAAANAARAHPVCPVTDGRYDSIQEFIRAATTELVNTANRPHVVECIDSCGGGASWYGAGCKTGKDVIRMLSDGWPEGRKRLAELTAELLQVEVHAKDRRRKRVRADFGDSVDIHAIYAGHLDSAWEIAKRRETFGPQHVDILANMICSGCENADVLFWRGAAAIVLADKLEAAGYTVRIVVGFGGRNDQGEQTSCRVTVKEHDKPLDIASTASVILPGFFRAIGHAWLAAHAGGALSSYGISVANGNAEDQELVLSHDVRNADTARKWLTRIVTDFNDGVMVAA